MDAAFITGMICGVIVTLLGFGVLLAAYSIVAYYHYVHADHCPALPQRQDIAKPMTETLRYQEAEWYKLPERDSGWLHLGVCPRPRTTWEVFTYHLCHGLLMRYPLREVLVFSWRQRHAFRDFGEDTAAVVREYPHANIYQWRPGRVVRNCRPFLARKAFEHRRG